MKKTALFFLCVFFFFLPYLLANLYLMYAASSPRDCVLLAALLVCS